MTRLVGRVAGGETGELVGFDNCDSSPTCPVKLVLNNSGYSVGNWRVEKHIRGVRFGGGGVTVSRKDGNAKPSTCYVAPNGVLIATCASSVTWPSKRGRIRQESSVGRKNGDGTFVPSSTQMAGAQSNTPASLKSERSASTGDSERTKSTLRTAP